MAIQFVVDDIIKLVEKNTDILEYETDLVKSGDKLFKKILIKYTNKNSIKDYNFYFQIIYKFDNVFISEVTYCPMTSSMLKEIKQNIHSKILLEYYQKWFNSVKEIHNFIVKNENIKIPSIKPIKLDNGSIYKIEINNIKNVSNLCIEFKEKLEGWHVILGNNGSGKSTIVKSIAAVLVGYKEIGYTQQNWNEWLNQNSRIGEIKLTINSSVNQDINPFEEQQYRISLEKTINGKIYSNYEFLKEIYGFSCSFGTYRRLSGGDERWKKIYESAPRAAAHLSIFSEDVALTESLTWLKELEFKRLKEEELQDKENESSTIFKYIKSFINTSELLPFGVQFEEIDIEGEPIFKDGYGNKVKVTQLSDGFRSILSLTFELIRQMINSYSVVEVFKNNPIISIHGVVLIDEVDTHLHPTWQTKIGKWFTKHFPNIQFIVTTHSPLICRACDNGTIWKLPDPNKGENQTIQQIVGHEKDLLVFGDILDAYDTDVFGENITRGEAGKEKHKIYRDLMRKKRYDIKMTQDELKELEHLKTIFQSNVETE